MTARLIGLGLVAAAAMVLAIPRISQGAPVGAACTCAQTRAAPVARRAARGQARSLAYAERFYNYWKAAPVSMTGWHGEWRPAPDDWMASASHADGYAWNGSYEGGYYGPPAYEEAPGLTIDRRGWSGGVGGIGAGGGGYGAVVIARGGRGLNGPTYNDYGQSFQYNPSQAGPWLNRVPPSSGGSGGGRK